MSDRAGEAGPVTIARAPEMSSRGRPRLLDLFCGAGGAAMGYHRAGFDVVGVDIAPQPNYPFEFHQADATGLEAWSIHVEGFDAIHASPPCQFGTAYRRRPDHVKASPNLIPETRALLRATGLPYVIENLWLNRQHLIDPVKLCGSMFRLDVQRHRAFEVNFPVTVPACDHAWQTPRFPPATNRTNPRSTVEVGVWRIPLATQQKAMGIDWMTLTELSEAIPPLYTTWLGCQLIDSLAVTSARTDCPSLGKHIFAFALGREGDLLCYCGAIQSSGVDV